MPSPDDERDKPGLLHALDFVPTAAAFVRLSTRALVGCGIDAFSTDMTACISVSSVTLLFCSPGLSMCNDALLPGLDRLLVGMGIGGEH